MSVDTVGRPSVYSRPFFSVERRTSVPRHVESISYRAKATASVVAMEAPPTVTASVVDTTSATSASTIRRVIDALDLEMVAKHFADAQEGEDMEPFVVCEGVSVDDYNEYVADGEDLRIALRFLALDCASGRVLILEYPTLAIHEATAQQFQRALFETMGNSREIAAIGTVAASQPDHPDKAADVTYGPLRDTPNQMQSPPRSIATWFTLVVEVGRLQSWKSLLRAAKWWSEYEGIQYVLLLKVSADGTEMRYALYDMDAPVVELPLASVEGVLTHEPHLPPVLVSFDMHRVLGIPEDLDLPAGVKEVAHVDLREVMSLAIRSI